MNGNKIKLLALTLAALMLAGGLVFLVPADESDADSASNTMLYASGRNNYGQLGTGTELDLSIFTQTCANLGSIVDVQTSDNAAVIQTSTGLLFGMGRNNYGQLGNNDTTSNFSTPIQIGAGLGTVTKFVFTGYNLYFISEGRLFGTGYNVYGQMGNGTTTNVTTPIQIGAGLGTVVDVWASSSTTFFKLSDNSIYGTGENTSGQLGNGTTTNVTTPIQIGAGLGTVKDVALTSSITYLLMSDGKVYGMGFNTNKQIDSSGNATITSPTQIAVSLNLDIESVVVYSSSSFFITSDGKLYGVGTNSYGQMLNNNTTDITTVKRVATSFSNITNVYTSGSSSFFITSDGNLYGAGSNSNAQMGDGTLTNFSTVKQLGTGAGTIVGLSTNYNNSMFWTLEGDLFVTGKNTYGQLGDGTTTDITEFTKIDLDSILVKKAVLRPNYTFLLAELNAVTATIESNNTSYGTVSTASITDIEPGTEVTISQDGLTLTIGAFGSSVATPTTSTAQYTYAFSGWYVNNVALQTGDTIDEDVTIEARFTQTLNQYTVTFTAGSGGTVSPASVTVDYGTSISASDNVVTVGTTPVTATPDTSTAQYTYAFDSWTNASGTVTEDRTITANFTTTLNSYTVTWSINGIETEEEYDYGETPTHEDPAIEGYTFEGWDPAISTVTGDITYTAILDPIEYTVTFDAQGGTVDPASAVGSIDDPIALPTPTKQFYSFDGWYDAATEGTLVSSPYTPTADITLYAYWSEVTYTITFDANGGTVDTPTLSGSPITAVTLPRALQSGFYFAGWYTAASEGELVALAGALMYPTENVTYYAQYSDAKVYFNGVNFNNNGGYGAPGPLSHTAASKGSYDFTIPETVPTLDGKTFRGWAKTSTESAKYQPGDTISVAADAQVTLYAIWEDQQNTNETLLSLIPLLIVIATVMIAATAAFKFRDGDYMGIIYLVIGIVVIIMLLTMFVIPVINEV